MFWKKKGIDYNSSEFWAIETAMEMVGQTAKRYRSPCKKSTSHLSPPVGGAPHYTCCTCTKSFVIASSHCFTSEILREYYRKQLTLLTLVVNLTFVIL